MGTTACIQTEGVLENISRGKTTRESSLRRGSQLWWTVQLLPGHVVEPGLGAKLTGM